MFSTRERLVLDSPAKINLYLNVVGVRENGYHDIESVVVPIALCDEIVLEPRPEGVETVVVVDEALGDAGGLRVDDGNNLTNKAARLLKDRTGHPGGVHIELKKRIPIGGGMGGGSSNAATVLLGLNKLWSLSLSRAELAGMGAELGCDVPAMVHGRAVLATGLGEVVDPLNGRGAGSGRSWWLVLANPGFGVSTRDVYSRLGSVLTSPPLPYKRMVSALTAGDVEAAAGALYNALEYTVLEKYPLIRILLETLKDSGASGCMVSGSGASVFGLARDRDHAESVLEQFRRRLGHPVWCCVSRTLPDGVMAAHGPLEA